MSDQNSKPSNENRQLSLFDNSQSDLPLPERIAIEFGFPLQKQNGKYAIRDWVTGVAQTKQPARLWNEIKRERPELFDSIEELDYMVSNGKNYPTDYADTETLYVITANMRSLKKKGIRDQIVQYLAKSGVIIDEFYRDPDKMIAVGQKLSRRNETGLLQDIDNKLDSIVRKIDKIEMYLAALFQSRLEEHTQVMDLTHFTIDGYVQLKSLNVPITQYASYGKQASALSRKYKYKIGSLPDPRFPTKGVNLYHKDVLEEVFKGVS